MGRGDLHDIDAAGDVLLQQRTDFRKTLEFHCGPGASSRVESSRAAIPPDT